jgi:hypothetical protein
MRRRRRKDGSHSDEPTVRYYAEQGVRRRKRCASDAEAEFERARMALEQGQTGRLTAPANRLTLIEFWPTYHSDAVVRLEKNTVADYEGTWRRRGRPCRQ